jgi:recombination protein RecT
MSESQAITRLDPKGPPKTLANLKSFIQQPAMMQSLQDVCTAILKPEQVAKHLFLAASRQPKLLECTLLSLCKSIATAAQLGLDCSGTLGSGYLVPYWNNKINCNEAQFIPGFRGLVDLARRSGSILDIQAHVVYGCDEWEYRLGTDPALVHRPNFNGDRGEGQIIGAYAVAWLRDARPHPEFMSRGELDAIKSASKSRDHQGNIVGPWRDHFAEMCKKTVVRRIVKLLPLSVEIAERIAQAEEDEIVQAPPEARPRRETAAFDVDQVLGAASEQTSRPGGTKETALQP